uniref:Uncharacterized protein n=1 Tax=Oreochromis aureus TaxID=47969 RepID=A0A668SC38_OREAU
MCHVTVCLCRCRMNSFMGGGLFCAGVESILLIVSTATDYWMQYRQSSNYMHQSLWRYCTPGNCFPHGVLFFYFSFSLTFFGTGFLVFLPMSIFSWLYIPGWASVVLTLISGKLANQRSRSLPKNIIGK